MNGTARTRRAGADLEPIWAENEELGLGLKKDISPLIDRALALRE